MTNLRWGAENSGAKGVHFGDYFGGFGFEGFALAGVVVFGIFAGAELEVEVAEVLVDGVFALAEVVQASLFDRSGDFGLWPEDVSEAAEHKECGG